MIPKTITRDNKTVMRSLYYYTVPKPILYPLYTLLSINPFSCPTYMPIASTYCRYCQCSLETHRKYYIYSGYARMIQRTWLRWQFARFHSLIFATLPNTFSGSHLSPIMVSIMLEKFRHLYYRKWSMYHWRQYVWKTHGVRF